LWLIERVEVYRGNAPDNVDRLGIGGAIFFWPRLPSATQAGVGAELGSFGARQAWGWFSVGSPRAASLVAVRRAAATNDYPFVNDDGQRFDRNEREEKRSNADYTQTDAWAIGRYELGRGARLHSVLALIDREQGATSLAVVPARRARVHTRRLLFGNSAVVPCARDERCRLELDASAVVASQVIRDPAAELLAVQARLLENQGERASERVRLALELAGGWSLGVAGLVAFENLRVGRSATLPRRGNRRALVPSATLDWQASEQLSLHALGALECHETRGISVRYGSNVESRSGSCGVAEPVARIGARYRLGDNTSLLANLARYVRVPSLSELYGASALVDGNPELRAETGVSLDAGVRWSSKRGAQALALDAFAFVRSVHDLIGYRRASLQALAPFNVSDARLLGIELAAAADLFEHLRLEAAGTLLDPRETTSDPALDPTRNDILTNMARLTFAGLGELYSAFAQAPLGLTRASLGAHYYYKSSRFADPAGLSVLPEQHFCDLELTSEWHERQIVVRAATRNVFDTRSADLLGQPVPGRSYHLSAELVF
jgi:vitamin B12 transporter